MLYSLNSHPVFQNCIQRVQEADDEVKFHHRTIHFGLTQSNFINCSEQCSLFSGNIICVSCSSTIISRHFFGEQGREEEVAVLCLVMLALFWLGFFETES